jgi:hypothetical protein
MDTAHPTGRELRRELPSEGFRTYLFSYYFDGARWSLSIPARSSAEAQSRLERLAYTGRCDGEQKLTIPYSTAAMWRWTAAALVAGFALGYAAGGAW